MEASEFPKLISSLSCGGGLIIGRQATPPYRSLIIIKGETVGHFNSNASALEWLFYVFTRSDDEIN